MNSTFFDGENNLFRNRESDNLQLMDSFAFSGFIAESDIFSFVNYYKYHEDCVPFQYLELVEAVDLQTEFNVDIKYISSRLQVIIVYFIFKIFWVFQFIIIYLFLYAVNDLSRLGFLYKKIIFRYNEILFIRCNFRFLELVR